MFENIKADFKAVFEMDPAATSKLEVIFTYAGFHALLFYRIAHWFYKMGMPFFARALSQTARFLTGVEIHPAAKIGKSLFIDHGMGVVIGETTEIGEHVVLFQGVTLGGTGKERGKRHPTIGSHVVIGAGAKVLGGITIGERVKVGANAVVLTNVPPNSTVVGVPGRVVRVHGERVAESQMLDHLHMPDPVTDALQKMQKQIMRLEQRLDSGTQPQSAKKEPREQKQARQPKQVKPLKPVPPVFLGEETVQERQARMARMEREERYKAAALRRSRGEEAAPPAQAQESAPAPAAVEGEQPAKKRRRRRTRKPRQEGQAEGGASEAGSDGGASETGGAGELQAVGTRADASADMAGADEPRRAAEGGE